LVSDLSDKAMLAATFAGELCLRVSGPVRRT
jgi:hypothetical protein